MRSFLILFLMLFLVACEDKPKSAEVHKESPVKVEPAARNALESPALKPTEPPQKNIEPDISVEEDYFEDFQDSELSAKASILRAQRKSTYVTLFQNPKKEETPKKFQIQEKDYGELPRDVSTFPVDRSRILTTDMRINAVLDDDINSQIPGVAIAIVDRSVVSPNNKYVLLPVFTKIICEYEGLELQGQTRLPIKCTRAIRPDGVSISLSDAIVADQLGRTGLTGEIDNRSFEMYSGAFIMAGISALAQSGVHQEQPYWRRNSQTILANNIGQVTAEVIRKNIDLRPVIYIKAGTRMQIRPRVDIVLKEPIPTEDNPGVKDEKMDP